jgi:hypothetical protein
MKAVKHAAMPTSRSRLFGLLAVLLALMAQLGSGATVPRIDPVAAAAVLCHTDDSGNTPARGPNHPSDCPICPLCAPLYAQALALTSDAALPTPPIQAILRPELPPPSTAPPGLHRSPSQPRAPPTLS